MGKVHRLRRLHGLVEKGQKSEIRRAGWWDDFISFQLDIMQNKMGFTLFGYKVTYFNSAISGFFFKLLKNTFRAQKKKL